MNKSMLTLFFCVNLYYRVIWLEISMSRPRLFDIMTNLIELELLGRLKWKVNCNYRAMMLSLSPRKLLEMNFIQGR